jgi:hypothetical protein
MPKLGLTINLPEVNSSPGKIYVITKIDETSNELNINPPIQLSKKKHYFPIELPQIF